jgi:hypothetical protein
LQLLSFARPLCFGFFLIYGWIVRCISDTGFKSFYATPIKALVFIGFSTLRKYRAGSPNGGDSNFYLLQIVITEPDAKI